MSDPLASDPVVAVLDEIVKTTTIPSASVCVRSLKAGVGQTVVHHSAGMARLDPAQPVSLNQVYDLASVTKALAASTVAASLVEQGRLDLHSPVAEHLPMVDPRITLAQLLTHSSGLPKWNNFYDRTTAPWGTTEARQQVIELALNTAVQEEPGSTHIYTDIGFITLLALLEKVGDKRLDTLFSERILAHVPDVDLRWGWPEAAATEDCPVRGGVVQGQVHDLNCVSLGGVSTHAGLFGSSLSVALLGEALLGATVTPETSMLPGKTLKSLWDLKGAGSHVGGWDTPTRGGYTSTGQFFPDDAIGHLGYTGTSLWIVPSWGLVVAFLTNRVHPVDHLRHIRPARPQLHDAVASHCVRSAK
ncbi:MAG: serine hydrolase domain-containing protein [Myxococcota bacterium]